LNPVGVTQEVVTHRNDLFFYPPIGRVKINL